MDLELSLIQYDFIVTTSANPISKISPPSGVRTDINLRAVTIEPMAVGEVLEDGGNEKCPQN